MAVASVSFALALHSTALDYVAHFERVMCYCVLYFLPAE